MYIPEKYMCIPVKICVHFSKKSMHIPVKICVHFITYYTKGFVSLLSDVKTDMLHKEVFEWTKKYGPVIKLQFGKFFYFILYILLVSYHRLYMTFNYFHQNSWDASRRPYTTDVLAHWIVISENLHWDRKSKIFSYTPDSDI